MFKNLNSHIKFWFYQANHFQRPSGTNLKKNPQIGSFFAGIVSMILKILALIYLINIFVHIFGYKKFTTANKLSMKPYEFYDLNNNDFQFVIEFQNVPQNPLNVFFMTAEMEYYQNQETVLNKSIVQLQQCNQSQYNNFKKYFRNKNEYNFYCPIQDYKGVIFNRLNLDLLQEFQQLKIQIWQCNDINQQYKHLYLKEQQDCNFQQMNQTFFDLIQIKLYFSVQSLDLSNHINPISKIDIQQIKVKRQLQLQYQNEIQIVMQKKFIEIEDNLIPIYGKQNHQSAILLDSVKKTQNLLNMNKSIVQTNIQLSKNLDTIIVTFESLIDGSTKFMGLFGPIHLIITLFFYFRDRKIVVQTIFNKFKDKKEKQKTNFYSQQKKLTQNDQKLMKYFQKAISLESIVSSKIELDLFKSIVFDQRHQKLLQLLQTPITHQQNIKQLKFIVQNFIKKELKNKQDLNDLFKEPNDQFNTYGILNFLKSINGIKGEQINDDQNQDNEFQIQFQKILNIKKNQIIDEYIDDQQFLEGFFKQMFKPKFEFSDQNIIKILFQLSFEYQIKKILQQNYDFKFDYSFAKETFRQFKQKL